MNKKPVFFISVIALIMGISFLYLEFKINSNKKSLTIQLPKNHCLNISETCTYYKKENALTIFCKNGDSAHLELQEYSIDSHLLEDMARTDNISLKRVIDTQDEKKEEYFLFFDDAKNVLNAKVQINEKNLFLENIKKCDHLNNVEKISFITKGDS